LYCLAFVLCIVWLLSFVLFGFCPLYCLDFDILLATPPRRIEFLFPLSFVRSYSINGTHKMVSCLSELVLFLSYRYKKSTLWDTLPKLVPLPWQQETLLVIIHGNKLHDGDSF